MATSLVPLSLSAPGFFGLNTQEAAVDLPVNWAVEAVNCVIDKYGRVAARKGWIQTTTTPISGTPNIKSMHEYIDKTGASTILSCAGNKIYSGTTTLTDLSAPGTITADNWKIVNFNNKAYFFQLGHVPLEYDGSTIGYATRGFTARIDSTAYSLNTIVRSATATPYYYVCTTAGTSAGTPPTWSTTVGGTTNDGTVIWTTYEIEKADSVLGALGRLWIGNTTTDKTVVYYSDTLIGHAFYGGNSGSIDLKTVWTNGMDEIVAITTFNGMLVILAKKSILLYSNATNPSTMSLVEHIKGIGCIARDSIQDIGDDLIFISNKGLMSLSRAVNQDNIATNDLSANVRDEFVSFINQETPSNIKSTYNDFEGFYLVSFPTSQYSYCFDVRSKLEDQTFRVTSWESFFPTSFLSSSDKKVYLGMVGVIGQYSSYLDNGNTYQIRYRSTWQHLDTKTQLKLPKSLEVTIVGGFNSSLRLKMAFDYSIKDYTYTKQITTGTVSEYNIAEYGISEYVGAGYIGTYKYQLLGSGRTFNFGIESVINGSALSIQKIDILTKMGRII